MWVSGIDILSHFIPHSGANKLKIAITQIAMGSNANERPIFSWNVHATPTGFWISGHNADQAYYFSVIHPDELWAIKYKVTKN